MKEHIDDKYDDEKHTRGRRTLIKNYPRFTLFEVMAKGGTYRTCLNKTLPGRKVDINDIDRIKWR